MKLLTLTLLLAGLAAAQTVTYNMPAGITCIGSATVNPIVVETCPFRNMQPEQPADGGALPSWALPYALANFGGYWQQIDFFQTFEVQGTPVAAATYCPGAGKWISAAMDNGDTLLTYDCAQTSQSNLIASIHAEIQAHTYTETYRCGGPRGSSNACTRYDWAIDAGFVNITPVQ